MKIDYGPNQDFINLYENHSTKEMSKIFNVSTTSIWNHAKKIGYTKQRSGKLSDEDKENIKSQYLLKTSTELAKEYSVSRGMITKIWYDAQLKGKDNRNYYFNSQDFFEKINTEEKAYLLGFFAADGCLYEPKDSRQYIIRIAINSKDIEILNYFKEYFDTNKPIYSTESNGHFYSVLELSSNKMGQDLINLGIFPQKTYKKTWVQLENNFLQNAFIRGYFDGDGSISSNIQINQMHSVEVGISGYQNNLEYFLKYLNKNNIKANFIEDKRKNKYTQEEPFGRIVFSNKLEKNKFLNLIYPENSKIYLTRKFILAQKFMTFFKENPKTWTTQKNS